jgi:hypothetical protein
MRFVSAAEAMFAHLPHYTSSLHQQQNQCWRKKVGTGTSSRGHVCALAAKQFVSAAEAMFAHLPQTT